MLKAQVLGFSGQLIYRGIPRERWDYTEVHQENPTPFTMTTASTEKAMF